MTSARGAARSWFAPEVIQTSRMDCGPASLASVLSGFGLRIDYGRLREACQTDIDGTSVDTLEDVALQLGLDAEQIIVPVDHLEWDAASLLPAVLVVRQPDSGLHFVVVWRKRGPLLEVMDPGAGRRWVRWESLRRDVFVHLARLPAGEVRDWAGGEAFVEPLARRMRAVGLSTAARHHLLQAALADPAIEPLAALDAATRLVDKLVAAGGVDRGHGAAALLTRLASARYGDGQIPDELWTIVPATGGAAGELLLHGAVLLGVRGRTDPGDALQRRSGALVLSDQQLTVLRTERPAPWRRVLGWLRREGALQPALLGGALLVATAALTGQALLLRGILDLGRALSVGTQRLGALALLLVFFAALLLLQLPIAAMLAGIGRRLEVTLRAALAAKVPRIGDRYFHSRLVSDMAERAHALGGVRGLPALAAGALTAVVQTVFTLAAIAWLTPSAFAPAVAAVAVSMTLALVAQRWLSERDLRARGHGAALARWYLEAFLGSWCVRAHTAGPALQREQEAVLVEWTRAQLRLRRATLLADALQSLCGLGSSAWLLFGHVSRSGNEGATLLLAYWAVSLPTLGQSLAALTQQLPAVRNTLARLLEPLDAPEEYAAPRAHREGAIASGVEIALRGVTVHAGGHEVLAETDLHIAAGTHVAVVGASGAGKSTLVGLLLGWHRPATGAVVIDGEPLDDACLARLRGETAWVDPAVHLFNRAFVDNLVYGQPPGAHADLGPALEAAELREVLERLPRGMQTPLGEGGGLLSGGEGQRVRLGRAMLRANARLAILDEPFRGLDRERRRALLAEARRRWQGATLLCVTHDIEATLGFGRVIVVDGGSVVEDGPPQELAARASTRFAALLDAHRAVRRSTWGGTSWRRWRVERGAVSELRPLSLDNRNASSRSVDSSEVPFRSPDSREASTRSLDSSEASFRSLDGSEASFRSLDEQPTPRPQRVGGGRS